MRKVVQLKGLFSVLLAIFLCGKLAGLTGPLHQDGPIAMALVLPNSGRCGGDGDCVFVFGIYVS